MTQIHGSPVFILGHWRSGTTLLHNMLSVDPQFGYVSYVQGLFPHCFQNTRLMGKLIGAAMPAKRPMDNMQISSDSPQEEELALIAQSGHSLYNMWIAPHRLLAGWMRYGLLADPIVKKQWGEGYVQLLKAATYACGGKRLLLKNPANTARIDYLVEQFPHAKFIYIYRNPYRVFESTRKLYRTVIPFFQLNDSSDEVEEEVVLKVYQEMFDSYDKNRVLIPEGSLIEVKYEDFVQDKLQGLRTIYTHLKLGNFTAIEPHVKQYLQTIRHYETNEFNIDEVTIEKVNLVWGEAFERYGYPKYQSTSRVRTDV